MTTVDNSDLLNALMMAAWERAKGELWAMSHFLPRSHYPAGSPKHDPRSGEVIDKIKAFVDDIEDNYF